MPLDTNKSIMQCFRFGFQDAFHSAIIDDGDGPSVVVFKDLVNGLECGD